MNKHSKILSLLLAGLMAFASLPMLVACEGEGDDSVQESSTQGKESEGNADNSDDSVNREESETKPSDWLDAIYGADKLTIVHDHVSGYYTSNQTFSWDGSVAYYYCKSSEAPTVELYVDVSVGKVYTRSGDIWTAEENGPKTLKECLDTYLGLSDSAQIYFNDGFYDDRDEETGRFNMSEDFMSLWMGSVEIAKSANFSAYLEKLENGFQYVMTYDDYERDGESYADNNTKITFVFDSSTLTLPQV